MSAYTLEAFVKDLRAVAPATTDPGAIAGLVRPMARELALARTWLQKSHYRCDPDQGFGVHVLHEEPDHTLFVIAAAWLPGRGVAPHNHGTWAVVAGVDGPERNTFWKPLDDGSRPGYAKIAKVTEKDFDRLPPRLRLQSQHVRPAAVRSRARYRRIGRAQARALTARLPPPQHPS